MADGAVAADFTPAPVLVAEAGDSWSGPYVGAFIGAGGIVNDVAIPGFGGSGNFNGIGGEGVYGGVMLGYNIQVSSNLVIGIEGEIAASDLTTELNIPGFLSLDAQPEWTAAISGRLGWLTSPNTMLYLIGGYSYADYNVDISLFGGSASFSQEYHGFHVGTGIETHISDRMTARVEYRYTQYGGEDWGTGGFIDIEPSSHTGRIALAYNYYNDGYGNSTSSTPGYAPDSWSGIYLGLYGGAGAIVNDIGIPGFGAGNFNGIGGEGVLGGAMIGYDHQFGSNWVAGIQGEIGVTDLTTELNIPGFLTLDAQPEWTAAISGRLGWLPVPETMLYVIAGYSFADYNVDIAFGGPAINFNQDYNGYHVGMGMETYIAQNITARVEYRYTQYDGEDWGTGGFLDVEPSSHTGRFGLAWKFGG